MVSPWIAGALGWAFFGPLGGLFGYAAGSLFNAAQRDSAGRAAGGGGPQAGPEAARNGFIASLLALTAAMMKADGRATKSELDVVKQFFTAQFGRQTAQEALRLLRDLLEREIPLGPICAQIQRNMNYSQRLALLHFLFSLAHADGELHPAEDRLLARLAGIDVGEVTGAGTGLDEAGIARKTAVLREALATNAGAAEPLDVLAALGGFEIATMVGSVLQAAAERRVIVVDGFIASSAVLVASRIAPHVLQRCVFAHQSDERGHARLLQVLGAEPLIDLGLRVGEGSGAALAWPLLESACRIINEMASFESAGVSDKG